MRTCRRRAGIHSAAPFEVDLCDMRLGRGRESPKVFVEGPASGHRVSHHSCRGEPGCEALQVIPPEVARVATLATCQPPQIAAPFHLADVRHGVMDINQGSETGSCSPWYLMKKQHACGDHWPQSPLGAARTTSININVTGQSPLFQYRNSTASFPPVGMVNGTRYFLSAVFFMYR